MVIVMYTRSSDRNNKHITTSANNVITPPDNVLWKKSSFTLGNA